MRKDAATAHFQGLPVRTWGDDWIVGARNSSTATPVYVATVAPYSSRWILNIDDGTIEKLAFVAHSQ
jgi:hypothetical protein